MNQAVILDANFFVALWNILTSEKSREAPLDSPINRFKAILKQLWQEAQHQAIHLITINSVVKEIGHQTKQGLAIARPLRTYLVTKEVEANDVFKEISQQNQRQRSPWFETGWGASLLPEKTDILLLVLAKELAAEYDSVRMVTNDEGLQRAIRDLPTLMSFPSITITEPYMFLKLVEDTLEPEKAAYFRKLTGNMFRYFRTHRVMDGRPTISKESLPDLLQDVFLRKQGITRPSASTLSQDEQKRIAQFLETGADPSLPKSEQRFLTDLVILREYRDSKKAWRTEEYFEIVDQLVLNFSALLENKGTQRATALLSHLWEVITQGLDYITQEGLLRGEIHRVLHLIDVHYLLASFTRNETASEVQRVLNIQKALLLLFTGELHRLKTFLCQKPLDHMPTVNAVGLNIAWLRGTMQLLEGEPLGEEIVDLNFLEFLFRLGETLIAFKEFQYAKELLKALLCAKPHRRREVFQVLLSACRALNMSCDEIRADFQEAGIETPNELLLDHSDRRLDVTFLRKEWTAIKEIPPQFRGELLVLQQPEQGTLVVWIPALNSRFLVQIETEESLWNARTIQVRGGTVRIVNLAPPAKKQWGVRGKILLRDPDLEIDRFIVPI